MMISPAKTMAAAVVSGIGASLCCVGPLVLVMLGVGGTWVGSLTRLEPVRPLFIGMTALALGSAFRRLYLSRQTCTSGSPCADPRTIRRQRQVFCIVAAFLAALTAAPWLAPWFI